MGNGKTESYFSFGIPLTQLLTFGVTAEYLNTGLEFDLKTMRFAGNDETNALLAGWSPEGSGPGMTSWLERLIGSVPVDFPGPVKVRWRLNPGYGRIASGGARFPRQGVIIERKDRRGDLGLDYHLKDPPRGSGAAIVPGIGHDPAKDMAQDHLAGDGGEIEDLVGKLGDFRGRVKFGIGPEA